MLREGREHSVGVASRRRGIRTLSLSTHSVLCLSTHLVLSLSTHFVLSLSTHLVLSLSTLVLVEVLFGLVVSQSLTVDRNEEYS